MTREALAVERRAGYAVVTLARPTIPAGLLEELEAVAPEPEAAGGRPRALPPSRPGAAPVGRAVPEPVIAATWGARDRPRLRGRDGLPPEDVRITREDAWVGLRESDHGITPGFCGTQRLPHLIGCRRALAPVIAGTRIGAAEVRAIGLVNRGVRGGQALVAAGAPARTLAGRAAVAARLVITAVDRDSDGSPGDGLAADLPERSRAADATKGIRAFLEERPPRASRGEAAHGRAMPAPAGGDA